MVLDISKYSWKPEPIDNNQSLTPEAAAARSLWIPSSLPYAFLQVLKTVLDFSRYLWKPKPMDNSQSLTREAAAGELVDCCWRGLGLGDYVIFFMAELTFFADLPQESLIQCMQSAWAAVRYDVPTVAAQTFFTEENRIRIVYNPARNTGEVKDWASRTVRVVDNFDNIEQFRHSISCKPIRDANGDQTFLYVLPHGSLPGACSVLVHTSHITFDARGLHTLFNAFMKKLVIAISLYPSEAYQKLEWGTEAKNLLPAPYEILGEAEICNGPEYDATLNSVISDVMTASQHGHGLKFRPPSDYAIETKRASFTFTARDSQCFFTKVKSLGFTVNHVCHAALTLACAEDNPVPEEMLESAVFAYLYVKDGRQRLCPPYSDRGGYPGFCLGVSSILIPADALTGIPSKDDVSRLIYVSDLMKKEYARQEAYPSLIAIAPEHTEMSMSLFENNANIPPPSTTTAPMYAGNGKGEQCLDPTFLDDNGKTVAEIRSFVTSVNKFDPAVCFRVWSWRNCLAASVDYNAGATPECVVEGLLNRWKELVACLMQ